MNVSIQDTHNLGWKLALVVRGIAKSSILATYESERRSIAQELIAFDQKFSKLWSKRPAKSAADEAGILMADFEQAFMKQQLFSAGFAVEYGASVLIAKDSSKQDLATAIPLGKRFPSFKVVNHCDARSWHLAQRLKANGLFHILLFAGDVSQPEQMKRVHSFSHALAKPSSLNLLQRDTGSSDREAVADILTVHSAPRGGVEFFDFPDLLRPFDAELGWDYDRIFVDGEPYYEGHGHAYQGYGVNELRGCVVVVRPDEHVAWIGELEDVEALEAYFRGFLAVG